MHFEGNIVFIKTKSTFFFYVFIYFYVCIFSIFSIFIILFVIPFFMNSSKLTPYNNFSFNLKESIVLASNVIKRISLFRKEILKTFEELGLQDSKEYFPDELYTFDVSVSNFLDETCINIK